MQKPLTWRELLGRVISDPQERQRISSLLAVNQVTLTRWAGGKSNPRPESLRLLLQVLPEHQALFRSAIEKEFPGFADFLKRDEKMQDELLNIPSAFYTKVLEAKAHTPKSIRYSALCDLVLAQALAHLDPHNLGMEIIVARCMPNSSKGKVRSLRESIGKGTPPWGNVQKFTFLGSESLAGQAVISGHLEFVHYLSKEHYLISDYRNLWEESAAAVPILQAGNIAGCFLVSSIQPRYFQSYQQILIQNYADMLALAFDQEDFYAPEDIHLEVMPPAQVQSPLLAAFRQRVMTAMRTTARGLSLLQVEQMVWQHIEEDLLSVPLSQENEKDIVNK